MFSPWITDVYELLLYFKRLKVKEYFMHFKAWLEVKSEKKNT